MFSFNELGEILGISTDELAKPDFNVTSVEFDSRKITPGALFVPLVGENDGHTYWQQAKDKGAVATLWQKEETFPEDFPYLKVQDTTQAFQKIAKAYLNKIAPKVVAITGSNGKTTTKDLTENVLHQKFKTYKTQGNYNNDLGLPYTILHMPKETEVLVLEMGMDHAGEIAFLSQLAKPDAAAITLIGESHLEYFNDRSGIAAAKMEIVTGLKEDGFLIAPGDEELLIPLLKEVKQKVYTFQLVKGPSDFYGEILEERQGETLFRLNFLPDMTFSIPVSGKFNVKNALVAAAFGKFFGLTPAEIQRGLGTVSLTKNRSQWIQHKGLDILADVYNANPTAMSLVLESFSQIPTNGRRIAVLGDMLELGKTSGALHEKMANFLFPTAIEEVFLYGPEMKNLFEVLKEKYPLEHLHYFAKDEKAQLTSSLLSTLKAPDKVVLKASNGMHLDEVLEKILAE